MLKKNKLIIFITLLSMIQSPIMHAQKKKKVIYEYKKFESIDLGSLEIKGSIVTPGDLTVKQKGRKVFDRDVFERFDFDKEIQDDITNMR